jgi:phosphate-selective porin OprO/OprP
MIGPRIRSRWRDGFIGIKNDVANVRVGHFKEPFSLEQQYERPVHDVEEPSLPTFSLRDTTWVSWRIRRMFDKTMTWLIGAFKDTDDTGKVSATGANVTARLTVFPGRKRAT